MSVPPQPVGPPDGLLVSISREPSLVAALDTALDKIRRGLSPPDGLTGEAAARLKLDLAMALGDAGTLSRQLRDTIRLYPAADSLDAKLAFYTRAAPLSRHSAPMSHLVASRLAVLDGNDPEATLQLSSLCITMAHVATALLSDVHSVSPPPSSALLLQLAAAADFSVAAGSAAALALARACSGAAFVREHGANAAAIAAAQVVGTVEGLWCAVQALAETLVLCHGAANEAVRRRAWGDAWRLMGFLRRTMAAVDAVIEYVPGYFRQTKTTLWMYVALPILTFLSHANPAGAPVPAADADPAFLAIVFDWAAERLRDLAVATAPDPASQIWRADFNAASTLLCEWSKLQVAWGGEHAAAAVALTEEVAAAARGARGKGAPPHDGTNMVASALLTLSASAAVAAAADAARRGRPLPAAALRARRAAAAAAAEVLAEGTDEEVSWVLNRRVYNLALAMEVLPGVGCAAPDPAAPPLDFGALCAAAEGWMRFVAPAPALIARIPQHASSRHAMRLVVLNYFIELSGEEQHSGRDEWHDMFRAALRDGGGGGGGGGMDAAAAAAALAVAACKLARTLASPPAAAALRAGDESDVALPWLLANLQARALFVAAAAVAAAGRAPCSPAAAARGAHNHAMMSSAMALHAAFDAVLPAAAAAGGAPPSRATVSAACGVATAACLSLSAARPMAAVIRDGGLAAFARALQILVADPCTANEVRSSMTWLAETEVEFEEAEGPERAPTGQCPLECGEWHLRLGWAHPALALAAHPAFEGLLRWVELRVEPAAGECFYERWWPELPAVAAKVVRLASVAGALHAIAARRGYGAAEALGALEAGHPPTAPAFWRGVRTRVLPALRSAAQDLAREAMEYYGSSAEGAREAARALATRRCAHAGCLCLAGGCEAGMPARLCTGCWAVRYCSASCQKADWGRPGGHRAMCKRFAAERRAAGDAGAA